MACGMTSGKFAAWLRSSKAASWLTTGQANTVTQAAVPISTSSDNRFSRSRTLAGSMLTTTSMRICRPSQATAQQPVNTQPTMRNSMISSAHGIDTLKK